MNIEITLNQEIVDKIADAVLRRMVSTDDQYITAQQAAEMMGIRCNNPKSLSARMSQLCNPAKHKEPLTCYTVGQNRMFKRNDVIRFMQQKKRN